MRINKKGQASEEVIKKIIMVLFIVIILILGINSLNKIRDRKERIEAIQLKDNIEGIIENNMAIGTYQTEKLKLPPGTVMCFVDITRRDEAIKSYQIQTFPEVKDILESGAEENVFVIKNGALVDASYVRICLEEYPHFLCTDAAKRPLDVILEGKGKCTSLFFEIAVVSGDNRKDFDQYPDGSVFLMPYKETNWRDVLRYVPITMWNSGGKLMKYLYMTYVAVPNMDNTKVDNFISAYNKKKAIVVGESSVSATENIIVKDLSEDTYFAFWEKYSDIVLIDYNNEDAALIASLYAAELNAPIIFVDSVSILGYEGRILKKKIHIIDSIDLGDNEYVLNVVSDRTDISSEELKEYVVGDAFRLLKSQIDIMS